MEYGGCSRFWYGGCDGNNNRFSTQDECKAVCVEPEGRGIHGFGIHLTKLSVFTFRYFSIGSSANPLVAFNRPDACYLPKVQGPCEGYYPSWYYDAQRERCEQFIYGGCLGNNNRFQSRDLCENTCLLPDRVGESLFPVLIRLRCNSTVFCCCCILHAPRRLVTAMTSPNL